MHIIATNNNDIDNIHNGRHDDDDEGYKEFLAFLASSPNTEEMGVAVSVSVAMEATTSKYWEEETEGTAGEKLAELTFEQLRDCIGASNKKEPTPAESPEPTVSAIPPDADVKRPVAIETAPEFEDPALLPAASAVAKLAIPELAEKDINSSNHVHLNPLSKTMALSQPKLDVELKKKDLKSPPKPKLEEELKEDDERATRIPSNRPHNLRRSNQFMTGGIMSNVNFLEDLPAIKRPPRAGHHPDYPFENVVFQGGGAKGAIYVGAMQAFEELGILPYLKRFAGASAGSCVALSLALGLSAEQAKAEMDRMDMSGFLDGGSSKISQLRNMSHRLGMHRGETLLKHMGDVLERYTGDANLTFLGLYRRFGTELCISVSNLSRSQGEYMHVTTTPELPIKYAVRASMSIPFLFDPVSMSEKGHGMHRGDLYVDGALFNNFPLTAFDGWFLEAGLDGSFHNQVLKLNPRLLEDKASAIDAVEIFRGSLANSYVGPNQATIGFRLTSCDNPDHFAYSSFLTGLKRKLGINCSKAQSNKELEIALPDTKLARAFLTKRNKERHLVKNQEVYEKAFAEFCRWFLRHSSSLQHHQMQGKYPPQAIPTHVLLDLLRESPPSKEFRPQALGFESWEEFADDIDIEAKGYFSKTDINMFWERYGIRDAHMKNRAPKTINGVGSFVQGIVWAPITSNEEQILRDPTNVARCCVLDTMYVGTMDFDLEQGDKEFLYEMGKVETLIWVKKRATELSS